MPIGGTALYDAVGKSINYAGAQLNDMPNEDKPDKVIVVILTDGQENASHEFSREKVAEMIKHQKDVYSWEFIFLAANQDAFAVGGALNIKALNTANFSADEHHRENQGCKRIHDDKSCNDFKQKAAK